MDSKYLLEVNHMTKTLVSKKVVNSKTEEKSFTLSDFNFAIEPGYILGIVGKNGAGKTSLINTVLGLYKPDEGFIKVSGYDRVTEAAEAKKKMAFITDDCLFPLDLSPKAIGKTFGSPLKRCLVTYGVELKKVFQVIGTILKPSLIISFGL